MKLSHRRGDGGRTRDQTGRVLAVRSVKQKQSLSASPEKPVQALTLNEGDPGLKQRSMCWKKKIPSVVYSFIFSCCLLIIIHTDLNGGMYVRTRTCDLRGMCGYALEDVSAADK